MLGFAPFLFLLPLISLMMFPMTLLPMRELVLLSTVGMPRGARAVQSWRVSTYHTCKLLLLILLRRFSYSMTWMAATLFTRFLLDMKSLFSLLLPLRHLRCASSRLRGYFFLLRGMTTVAEGRVLQECDLWWPWHKRLVVLGSRFPSVGFGVHIN